jgi:hypothetical protein
MDDGVLSRGTPAGSAQTAQFDDLPVDFETMRRRAAGQLSRKFGTGNLDRVAARFADQELALMRVLDVAAREKRIFRLDPMYEAVFDQKVEHAVHGGRRHAAALRFERGEQVVGADRPLACRNQRVDLAAQRGKRETACVGDGLSARESVSKAIIG